VQKLRILFAAVLLSITGISVVGLKAFGAPRSAAPIPPQACSANMGAGGSNTTGSGVAVFSGGGSSSGSGYTGYSGTGGSGGSGDDESSSLRHRKAKGASRS